MAIENTNILDGMGYDEDSKTLFLLIEDELSWDKQKEMEHLNLLREKINSYIAYIGMGEYRTKYKNEVIKKKVIEIHSKYSLSENAKKYMDIAKKTTKSANIFFEIYEGDFAKI